MRRKARSDDRVQLLTIPYSHYVDAARWALSMAKVDFEEHGFMPGEHIFPVLKARACGDELLVSQSSAFMAPTGKHYTAVPFAWLPDGGSGIDSWDIILNVAKLLAPTPALKAFLDQVMGPATRKFAYMMLMDPRNEAAWTGLCTRNKSLPARAMFRAVWSPVVKQAFVKEFDFEQDGVVDACVEEVASAFTRGDEFLRARKGAFFGGDTPGGADIAFAALAAPAVLPPNYCGAKYHDLFAMLEDDAKAAERLQRFRRTETGKFCLSMYEEHYVREASP